MNSDSKKQPHLVPCVPCAPCEWTLNDDKCQQQKNRGAKLMASFQFDWNDSIWLTTTISNRNILLNLEIAFFLFVSVSCEISHMTTTTRRKIQPTPLLHHTMPFSWLLLHIKKVSKPTMDSVDLKINQLIQFHGLFPMYEPQQPRTKYI